MPHAFYELLSLVEARPMESVAVAIATILYMRLMLSGPRAH
jgi:hypothetical protein